METKVTAYHLNGQYDAEVEVDVLNRIYTIKLNIDQQEAVGKGVTVFDALLQIHLIMEPAGWLIGVNASRVDTEKVISAKGNYNDYVTVISGNGNGAGATAWNTIF